MRTSLNKIQTIEEFLTGAIAPDEKVVFEAKQLLDQNLMEEVALQRKTYRMITAYSRIRLKEELNSLHHKLKNDPAKKAFWNSILSIFQKQ